MHSCFGGKTVVFKGTVDECNEFRHIIVAISLFCIVRRIGKVLFNLLFYICIFLSIFFVFFFCFFGLSFGLTLIDTTDFP